MARLRRDQFRMLGNGYCARPPELDCSFESVCENCTFFQTSIQFRPALQAQHDDAAAKTKPAASTCSSNCSPACTRRLMNQRTLRTVRDDDLPAARVDELSARVLTKAIDTLAALRTTYWLGDCAVHLHALVSLIAQAEQMLPDTVRQARDQDYTWTQIGQLLNLAPSTTAKRYRRNP
jgi:hypothetical protein